MRKKVLFLLCLFSGLIAFGQEPAAPTQEWCEWAFWQIPDHKVLSEVDSTAFSADLFCLLKEMDRLSTWDEETYQSKPCADDYLVYWYDGMEGSVFDGGRTTLSFDYTPKSSWGGDVTVTINHPDYLNNDGTRVSKHTMSIIFEHDAWRINDWDAGKWMDAAIVFKHYQEHHGNEVSIDSRALEIIHPYLELHPIPVFFE